MAGIHRVNLVQGPFWCCGRQRAGRSEPLETRISGWKGACSRWNLPSLSVPICRMGMQAEVSHWGAASGRMMAVRACPTLRRQTSQGWLVAVPSSELWAGPQRRGHGRAQCDASGFSQVQGSASGWASPSSALSCRAGHGNPGSLAPPFPPGSSEPWGRAPRHPLPQLQACSHPNLSRGAVILSWPLLTLLIRR